MKSKYLQGIKDKVIVEILNDEKVTEGGIIVPETVDRSPQKYGKIISMGEDVTGLNIGDTIVFAKFGGQDILFEGKLLKVLMINEIYGVIKES